MKKWFIIAVVGLILTGSAYGQADLQENFNRGNVLYADGDFRGAIEAFKKAAESGYASPELYFNLGNAYFRDGQLGKSLVNYIRARRLDPRDEDILTNIEFARQYTVDRLEVSEEAILLDYVNRFFDWFRLSEIAWVSAILYLILVIIIIAGFLYRWIVIPKAVLSLVLVLFIIAGILTAVKYDRDVATRTGVVAVSSVDVKNGPGEDFKNQFTAHAGLIFSIDREDSGWYLVNFENRVKGWLPKTAIAEI